MIKHFKLVKCGGLQKKKKNNKMFRTGVLQKHAWECVAETILLGYTRYTWPIISTTYYFEEFIAVEAVVKLHQSLLILLNPDLRLWTEQSFAWSLCVCMGFFLFL